MPAQAFSAQPWQCSCGRVRLSAQLCGAGGRQDGIWRVRVRLWLIREQLQLSVSEDKEVCRCPLYLAAQDGGAQSMDALRTISSPHWGSVHIVRKSAQLLLRLGPQQHRKQCGGRRPAALRFCLC